MTFIKRPSSLLISLSAFVLLIRYSFSATENEWFYEVYGYYGASFIEPLEIIALTTLFIGVWLCFFATAIQKRWWKIGRWFGTFAVLVLGVSLTIPYQGGGFINFPGVRELMILWSFVLIITTVFITIWRR